MLELNLMAKNKTRSRFYFEDATLLLRAMILKRIMCPTDFLSLNDTSWYEGLEKNLIINSIVTKNLFMPFVHGNT